MQTSTHSMQTSTHALQRIMEQLDNFPCPSDSAWTARCDIATEQFCYLVHCDGHKLNVSRHPSLPADQRPSAEMVVWYMTTKLFLKDARGLLTEHKFAQEFVKGRIQLFGDREKARSLSAVFQELGPRIRQIVGSAVGAGSDIPREEEEDEPRSGLVLRMLVSAFFFAKRLVRLMQLIGRPPLWLLSPRSPAWVQSGVARHRTSFELPSHSLLDRKLLLDGKAGKSDSHHARKASLGSVSLRSEESVLSSVAFSRLPWWRRHFGSDILVAAWLWLLGCSLYAGYSLDSYLRAASLRQALDLISSILFVVACVPLLYSSYPEQLLQLVEQLSQPPRELSCVEKYFTSNLLLLTTQIFVLGTVPFMGEALVELFDHPDSPRGYLLFVGLVFLLPLLFFWSYTAMDMNLRKNGGQGSSFIYDWLEGRGMISDERFWRRHLGHDAIATLWVMSAMGTGLFAAVMAALLVCPTLEANGIQLCPSRPFLWFLFFDGGILCMGMWLMTYATYPENFNASFFFRTPHLATEAFIEDDADSILSVATSRGGKAVKCAENQDKVIGSLSSYEVDSLPPSPRYNHSRQSQEEWEYPDRPGSP